MSLTVKIWCDGESEPEGLFNQRMCPNAPPNWFREKPRVAAELYALECGIGEWRVNVLDDHGHVHAFAVSVYWTVEASVREVEEGGE